MTSNQSKDDVARFITELNKSEKLRGELLNRPGLPAFVEVANRQGYPITEDAVRSYVQKHKAELGALRDEQLDGVCGGGSPSLWDILGPSILAITGPISDHTPNPYPPPA